MTDTRLPLMTQSLDTAGPVRQMNQDQWQNSANHEQVLSQYYSNMNAREKSRLSSVISAAVQLEPFLLDNDLDGAHDFLLRRRSALQNRIGNGESIDTEDTDAAIDMLRTGDVEGLKNTIAGLKRAGQVYGILSNSDMPSNVQEWQYYNSLDPAQKEQYLTMKRSNQVVNLGGQQVVPSQVNPAGAPQAAYNVTPKPEDMPEFRGQQAQAQAEGTAAGEATANANTTLTRAGGLLASFEDLKASAQNAPSGVLGNAGASVLNKSGAGGEYAQAQGDFTVKRAAAENAIREAFRVAGSGATSDRDALPFIEMLPTANDSDDVKIAKTNAAMQAVQTRVRTLAQSRGLPDPFAQGTTGSSGGKVRIRDPRTGRTGTISADQAGAAQQQGYEIIQ